jgi:hypothetical protein
VTSFEWDVRCADVELFRLQEGFTTYDFQNFSRILLDGFSRVVRDIHRETGSLASSAKVDVTTSTSERYEGHISVGGASGGVKNPVRYAASEFFGNSPKYGGPPAHSYFKSLGWTMYGSIGNGGIGEELVGPTASFISRGRRTPHPEDLP